MRAEARVIAARAPIVHPAKGDLLDLILLALAVVYAVRGYRRGLLVGGLSFLGFLAGLVLGALVGPPIARAVFGGGHDVNAGHALAQRVLALAVVFGIAMIGEFLGLLAGLSLRRRVAKTPLRPLDATGGAVLGVVGLLLVAWLLGSVVSAAPLPKVAKQIRRSLVLSVVDKVMPAIVHPLFADLQRLVQQHGLPPLFNPFGGIPLPAPILPAPNAGVVPPALRAAGPEVVKITGVAPSCDRALEGSGFIFASQHVMTNAHVVAGVRNPNVTLPNPGGATLAARVVLYDPNRDVAVLYVPGLTRHPLAFNGPVPTGADAVVAGYPLNGPLTATPARIAGDQEVTGPNISANRQVTREVYTLRARIREGNSGGPLLSPSGRVDGVVFAASVEFPDVGYALTSREVASDARAGATVTTSVSTQGCD
ncbi:MAG: MarP family serine protease [Actinomycetota bacterium]